MVLTSMATEAWGWTVTLGTSGLLGAMVSVVGLKWMASARGEMMHAWIGGPEGVLRAVKGSEEETNQRRVGSEQKTAATLQEHQDREQFESVEESCEPREGGDSVSLGRESISSPLIPPSPDPPSSRWSTLSQVISSGNFLYEWPFPALIISHPPEVQQLANNILFPLAMLL